MNDFIAHFHFLRPGWLAALAALPLLLWLWKRGASASDPWRMAVDPALLPHLSQQGGTRRSNLPVVLFGLAWIIATAALAGPAWRLEPTPLARVDSALIVALDVSERMRSPDLKPDRATRAKIKLASLLAARGDGQTGLIAWAGDAFTVAPLTDDAESLRDLVAALSPGVVPSEGQRPDRAIVLAQKLLADAGFAQGDLLLITDRANDRAIDAAKAAAASGLRVSVLGLGTEQGAPIPKADGGFVSASDGNILLPRLETANLQRLAAAGGGHYAPFSGDDADLAVLLPGANLSAKLRQDDDKAAGQNWRDEGPWLVLALLPLAALGFRRGWLMLFAFAFLVPTQQAQAIDWESLWKRDDQRAYEALQRDEAAKARSFAKDPALRGSAAYREGDYEAAQRDFAARDDADGHYNRGNALAQAGQFEEAISAYEEALARQPGMEDALANKAVVEELLKQQQQQQSSQSQSGDSQDGEKGEQDSSSQDSSGGEPSDESQEGEPSPSEDGEPQEGEQKNGSSSGEDGEPEAPEAGEQQADQQQASEQFEQQMQQALEQQAQEGEPEEQAPPPDAEAIREAEARQALEQALRRVPDDPGGLLRRKFQIEQQMRLRGNPPR